ncbi:MAG: glycosyltransferase family 39 protein [Chloroflexi bacterium]|nr:glycosyltransferase family 39 protein [Chloroflexota bacterium]
MNLFRVWQALPYNWLMPVAFFLTGLVYLYAAPNFEASDTAQHVGMIKFIAEEGALPVQSGDHNELYGQEASQPPLYYLIMAAVWNAFDTSDFEARYLPSPFTVIGNTAGLGNRNLLIYKQPYPPDLNGSSLALYAIRALTLGMGALTVWAVYQSARVVLPDERGVAVLAASLTAFNPQFLFISASVSNDTLVNMLAALIAWRMLVMLRDGFETRRDLALALLVALASLTKLSGLVLGGAVALAAIWRLIHRRDLRGFLRLASMMLIAWLLIAGWWYARNLTLYGEPFGTSAMLDFFGRRSTTIERLFREEFHGLRVSYWAVFGAFNTVAHNLFYQIMDALTLLGAGGLLVFAARNRRAAHTMAALAFLALLLALGAGALIAWSLQTWASTGRLLFPYITSASLLLALGIHALRIPKPLIIAPLLAFSLLAPFIYIMPNYDHPPAVDRPPASATEADARWGDLRLTAYEIPPAQTFSASDEIPVTLYWRVHEQSPLAYALVMSLVDGGDNVIAEFETWPGWGTMPHPWMTLHTDYRDEYLMQVPADARAAGELSLEIRWYVFPDGPELPAVIESGVEMESLRLALGSLAN